MTLTITGLETHPTGTVGLNAIINANWNRLEAMFAPLTATGTDAAIGWNATAKTFTYRLQFATLAASGTPTINFLGAMTQRIDLTGDATFSASNADAGRRIEVVVVAGASSRSLTFPAWTWVGSAAPTTIAANKAAILTLTVTGSNPADIIARWAVQP